MSKLGESSNDPLLDLNIKQIKNDLILFKNETLKDFKEAQKKILDKYYNLDTSIKTRFEEYENRIKTYELKITELSNLINTDKTLHEKVEQLLEFKDKTNDKLLTEKIRLDNFRNDLNSNITRIDKILSDSVIYPCIIRGIAKYKTFHELIDYVLTQCSLNLTFREKNIMDLKSYKTKIEKYLDIFNTQTNQLLKTTSDYTNACIKESEEKTKSLFSILEDRLGDTRIENANYSVGMEKLTNTLKKEINNFYLFKSELTQKVDTSVTDLRKDNTKIIKLFTGYKKGFNLLQHKFTQLSEFIKDMRFRINLKEDVQRREFSKISDLINFDKRKKGFYEGMEEFAKKNKNFESYLKEYINGKMSADDLLKRYNSMNNITTVNEYTQIRKSVGGNLNKFKKFNSFNNNLIVEDKNDINNLLRGSMAMPLRKKYSLDNDQIVIDNKKKREEIKEVDEEDLLSNHEHDNTNINLKRGKSLRKSLLNKGKKEKESDDFYENLYEDVNVDENEEEKNDLKKEINDNNSSNKSPKNSTMLNSKHGRGSLRNNITNVIKAEKVIKNLKKLNVNENPLKKDHVILKDKKININITNNYVSSNKIDSEINEEKNNSSYKINNSSNKINNSESNKNILKSDDNNSNKSSIINNNYNINKIVSADRFKRIQKDNKYNIKEKFNKKINPIKNNYYDLDYFLPSNLVHNATIVAYYSKNDDNLGNKKLTPEKKLISNKSEIKSASNLILTSFYNRNNKYDVNYDDKTYNKLGNKNKN